MGLQYQHWPQTSVLIFKQPSYGTSSCSCFAFCGSHECKGIGGPACLAFTVEARLRERETACCWKGEQWDGQVWKRKQPKYKLSNSTSNSQTVHQLWQQVLSAMCAIAEWNGHPNKTITSVPKADVRKWNLKLMLRHASSSAPVHCSRQMSDDTADCSEGKRQQGNAKGWGIFIFFADMKNFGNKKKSLSVLFNHRKLIFK